MADSQLSRSRLVEWTFDYKEKNNLIRKSLEHVTCIYVKGEEKIDWLKKIVQNVDILNVEKMIENNFRLKDENEIFFFKCYYHDKNRGICSCNNVFKIFQKFKLGGEFSMTDLQPFKRVLHD